MSELDRRRKYSAEVIVNLRNEIIGACEFASNKACVYATGSFGRHEASEHSDLDLFIAGKSESLIGSDGSDEFGQENLLNHLDEICVQAELIKASRRLGFPEFSGDGRYLDHHSIYEFTSTLGTEKDDVANTFTARLLLLLESKPLLEDAVYDEIVMSVIKSYWRDYPDHQTTFMPAFLANDILRIWRTFCVNYEARTEREPEDKKAKGKLKNYKLKHSRLLTCYSALLYLLAVYKSKKYVAPSDAFAMTKLTPTQRLEWLRDQPDLGGSKNTIVKLLDQYDRFLETTNFKEDDLVGQFMNKDTSRKFMNAAHEFGDSMFEALTIIGDKSKFHRLLVV
jgi:Nucleotidyltransferase domain